MTSGQIIDESEFFAHLQLSNQMARVTNAFSTLAAIAEIEPDRRKRIEAQLRQARRDIAEMRPCDSEPMT